MRAVLAMLVFVTMVVADGGHGWSGGNGDWTVVSGDVTLQVALRIPTVSLFAVVPFFHMLL
jgi:hypothetical protein